MDIQNGRSAFKERKRTNGEKGIFTERRNGKIDEWKRVKERIRKGGREEREEAKREHQGKARGMDGWLCNWRNMENGKEHSVCNADTLIPGYHYPLPSSCKIDVGVLFDVNIL